MLEFWLCTCSVLESWKELSVREGEGGDGRSRGSSVLMDYLRWAMRLWLAGVELGGGGGEGEGRGGGGWICGGGGDKV